MKPYRRRETTISDDFSKEEAKEYLQEKMNFKLGEEDFETLWNNLGGRISHLEVAAEMLNKKTRSVDEVMKIFQGAVRRTILNTVIKLDPKQRATFSNWIKDLNKHTTLPTDYFCNDYPLLHFLSKQGILFTWGVYKSKYPGTAPPFVVFSSPAAYKATQLLMDEHEEL
eukprot:CAMPEP_0174270398 /NCGR_PEP_ID=MMETSP0439-20130205/44299_1 /TAXON_ID=0 /ORGANISM="Stereomyxa ramosa, Strain Chinc5" /LENGTH=168 /DNA_ID=CAMNT_0015359709 /DNA_START=1033 /DNA_END=1535 /DNA_ORIENTATION=+